MDRSIDFQGDQRIIREGLRDTLKKCKNQITERAYERHHEVLIMMIKASTIDNAEVWIKKMEQRSSMFNEDFDKVLKVGERERRIEQCKIF